MQGSGLIGDGCLNQCIGLDSEIASASSVIAAQSPVEILEADEPCEKKRDQWKSPEERMAPASTWPCAESAGRVVHVGRFAAVIHSSLKS